MNEREQAAVELAGKLEDFANSFSDSENKIVATHIMRSHRTLQQGVMRLFLTMCKDWAANEEADFYDLRNEATVKLAKRIVELDDDYLPNI